MKFYLAASSSRQAAMKEVQAVIKGLGHTVISEWVDQKVLRGDDPNDGDRDIRSVLDADILIQETEPITGGKNVELGIAIICGKMIWIVGPINNPFQCKASVFFDEWSEIFELLKQLPIAVDLRQEAEC